jgi:transposase-like protein
MTQSQELPGTRDWRRLPNFRLDDVDRDKIIHLLLIDGLSTAIIARRFGVSQKTIRAVREDYLTAKDRRHEGDIDKIAERVPRKK